MADGKRESIGKTRYGLGGLVIGLCLTAAYFLLVWAFPGFVPDHRSVGTREFWLSFLLHGLFAAPLVLTPIGVLIGSLRDRSHAQQAVLARQVEERGHAIHAVTRDLQLEIEKHRETEQQLNLRVAALEAAANAVIITDVDGRIRWVNPAFTQLTGYPPEEAIGASFDLVRSDSNDEVFYREILETVRSGRSWRGEVVSRRRNGTLYAEEMTLTPMRDEQSRISTFIAIKSDITARKRIEEALRQSEERFQKFAASITDIVYRYDPFSNRYEFVSPSIATQTGYELADIYSDPAAFMYRIVHPDDTKRVFQSLEEHLRKGPTAGSWLAEYRIITQDGTERWVSDRKDFEFSPEGRMICINGVMRDITTRRRDEDELKRHRDHLDELVKERTGELRNLNATLQADILERKRAEESFKRLVTAVEQAAEIILITDIAGTILFVNPAFERITGYTCAEVIGQTPRVIRSGKHEPELYREMWRTILSGKVWSGYLINRRKDASLWEEEATISPVRDESGATVNFVAVMRDVTQERKMEKQLRQAQKLESIGQLAAGIAHEINTPTQYVGDNTRFLRNSFESLLALFRAQRDLIARHPEAVPAKEREAVHALEEEADLDFLLEEIPQALRQSIDGVDRVTEIVRAMKEFSHPGLEVRTAVNLNAALQSTLTVARNEYKYIADVVTDYDPTLPAVMCMPGEVNQVFLNLFVNAAQAIEERRNRESLEEKGRITVTTRVVDERWVEVRIGDTGTGIPEEVRDKIFDPFFTTKEVGRGTGQGLAISHSAIVDRHKGTLSFETELGKGTTFIVRLPI